MQALVCGINAHHYRCNLPYRQQYFFSTRVIVHKATPVLALMECRVLQGLSRKAFCQESPAKRNTSQLKGTWSAKICILQRHFNFKVSEERGSFNLFNII